MRVNGKIIQSEDKSEKNRDEIVTFDEQGKYIKKLINGSPSFRRVQMHEDLDDNIRNIEKKDKVDSQAESQVNKAENIDVLDNSSKPIPPQSYSNEKATTTQEDDSGHEIIENVDVTEHPNFHSNNVSDLNGIIGKLRGRTRFKRILMHDDFDISNNHVIGKLPIQAEFQDFSTVSKNTYEDPQERTSISPINDIPVTENMLYNDKSDYDRNVIHQQTPENTSCRLSLDDDRESDNLYDDEDDVGRFSLNFHQSTGGGSILDANVSNVMNGPPLSPISSFDFDRNNQEVANHSRFGLLKYFNRIYHKIKSGREESRRKRVEHLLSIPDTDVTNPRCHYFFWLVEIFYLSEWCDLADKGLILFLAATTVFTIIYLCLDEKQDKTTRAILLAVGVPLLICRVVWRPLYWIAWGKRVEKVSI